ncbi:MAG: DUF6443 domain-containing protein, partial [Bacteroidota bacterium]
MRILFTCFLFFSSISFSLAQELILPDTVVAGGETGINVENMVPFDSLRWEVTGGRVHIEYSFQAVAVIIWDCGVAEADVTLHYRPTGSNSFQSLSANTVVRSLPELINGNSTLLNQYTQIESCATSSLPSFKIGNLLGDIYEGIEITDPIQDITFGTNVYYYDHPTKDSTIATDFIFVWSFGGEPAPTTFIPPTKTGTYYFALETSFGCLTPRYPIHFTVGDPPLPPSVAVAKGFEGGSTTFEAPAPADASIKYVWYRQREEVITEINRDVLTCAVDDLQLDDHYFAKAYVLDNGSECLSYDSTAVPLTIWPRPVIEAMAVRQGAEGITYQLRTTESYNEYQWLWEGDSLAQTQLSFLTSQAGEYVVKVVREGRLGISLPFQLSSAQEHNYMVVNTVLREGVQTVEEVETLPNADIAQTVTYLDDIGRPLQEIAVKGSPAGKDVIQLHTYDALGRE